MNIEMGEHGDGINMGDGVNMGMDHGTNMGMG
jgi:hypothetical protein